MENSPLIITLALITLAIVLVAGVFQFMRVRNSQAKRGEQPGGVAGPSSEGRHTIQ